MMADCRVTCLVSSYIFIRWDNVDPTLDTGLLCYTINDAVVSKIEFIYLNLCYLSLMQASGCHVI